MTLKDMAKKVETYNELAEVMGTDKIELNITEGYFHNSFTNWKDLQKFIKAEYVKEAAQAILKADGYEMDGELGVGFTRWDGTAGFLVIETNLYRQ